MQVLDSQLCTFVKSSLPALSRWTGSPVPTEALPAWGALLHFLASYYDLSSFSSFDSSLTGLVSSEGMSGDVSPWCIPVSVLSVSLQSRTRVAQWLWDSVVSLLWTAPFALRQYCEAIIAEQQPTAEMLAVVNVVHGVLRLTRSLFTIVPGWAPWSAQWSSASEVLCAVLESCGTVADRIWGHSTSPLLYMTVDEVRVELCVKPKSSLELHFSVVFPSSFAEPTTVPTNTDHSAVRVGGSCSWFGQV